MDDLARTIFDALYEQRVAVAIASVLAAAVAALVAWRRGWFAAARRHPGRASAFVVGVLAVGLPLTWYLAADLDPDLAGRGWSERRPIHRAQPGAVGRVRPDGASASDQASPGPRSPRRRRRPRRPSSRSRTPRAFSRTDEFHFSRGSASLIELEPGRYHLRLEDFSVRNGPRPVRLSVPPPTTMPMIRSSSAG